jgi:hypothetical protein
MDGTDSISRSVTTRSSYADDNISRPQGAPVFPTFSATNAVVLKDGETDR